MKVRKLVALMCVLALMLFVVAAGCSSDNKVGDNANSQQASSTPAQEGSQGAASENKYEKKLTITTAAPGLVEGMDYNNVDEMSKFIQSKFNVDMKITPIGWDVFGEKNRVWINSGDMPDFTMWGFNFSDYKNYAEQGLIKALPDDFDTKYPTLALVVKKTGVADPLRERFGGKLYMIPKIIFFHAPTSVPVPHDSLYYRKDWADKLGIKLGPIATQEEILNMAREFKVKDPGGNGEGKTIGLGIGKLMLPIFFVAPFNPNAATFNADQQFVKVDGKYVWAPAQESTLEGLKLYKKAYDEGLIDKDFFAKQDWAELDDFYVGKNGMIYICGTGACAQTYYDSFANANPGKDPVECIDLVAVGDGDKKFHSVQPGNFWTGSVFNPHLDDEKFDRILAMMDWSCTDEGQALIRMGFEGKDYTKDGDKITITRPKNDKGNFKGMRELYPSYDFWYMFVILGDDFSLRDPAINPKLLGRIKTLFKEKEANGVLIPRDYDMMFFSAPNYNKTKFKLQDEYAKIVVKGGDIEANWRAWVKEKEPQINEVLKEINEKLAK